MKNFNKEIGAWLLIDGNTRERLAELLGITRPTLATRLTGQSEWTWPEACKLADVLDIQDLDELRD